ncbi:MAG: DUF5103 domain-containing protein [Bacteroidales bacterium]|nr:DUF5103 domain-containing protein [Bacteroidales bacterium]
MFRYLLLILTSFCLIPVHAQVVCDSLWNQHLRTATLYRSGIDQEAPIMLLGSDDHLLLRFDMLTDQPETFRFTIHHCDATWHIDELETYEYLTGLDEGVIDDYRPSFTTLQPYFNYRATVPANGSSLLLSGNYVVMVHPYDYPDSTVLSMRFMVSEELLNATAEVVRPTSGMRIYEDQEVNVAIEPKPDLRFGDYQPYQFSPVYMKLYLQQNSRLDLRRLLPFQGYAGQRLCYRWKEENVFPGGNSFRYFDISNLRSAMYNVQRVEEYGGEIFAIIRPDEDRSGKHFETREGLNGGMKVNVWDRHDPQVEADYVWVNLSLPMPRPFLNGSVHLAGQLTQWQFDDNSRMEWQPQYKAYTKRLLLKQGYYSYQLLFLPAGESVAMTSTLEGDHSETPNDYTLSVYYRGPSDRFDRLLSVRKIR